MLLFQLDSQLIISALVAILHNGLTQLLHVHVCM